MARSAGGARSGGRVRTGLVAHLRRLQETFPTRGWEAKIRAIETGVPIEFDTRTLFGAVYQFDPTSAGRMFSWRSDSKNVRRFVLDEHDTLAEIEEVRA